MNKLAVLVFTAQFSQTHNCWITKRGQGHSSLCAKPTIIYLSTASLSLSTA